MNYPLIIHQLIIRYSWTIDGLLISYALAIQQLSWTIHALFIGYSLAKHQLFMYDWWATHWLTISSLSTIHRLLIRFPFAIYELFISYQWIPVGLPTHQLIISYSSNIYRLFIRCPWTIHQPFMCPRLVSNQPAHTHVSMVGQQPTNTQ